jgi:hypothetical protein
MSSHALFDSFDRSKLRQGHNGRAHEIMKRSAWFACNLNQRNIESFFERALNLYCLADRGGVGPKINARRSALWGSENCVGISVGRRTCFYVRS